MARSARVRAVLNLASAVLLVAGVLGVSAYSTHQLVREAEGLNRTHDAIARLEGTLALVARVEAGSRSYALTGARTALEPYETALAEMPGAIADLRAVLADQPQQLASLQELEHRLRERIALARNIVEVRGRADLAAARELVLLDGDAARSLDWIRRTAGAMSDREERLLDQRRATMRATARRAMFLAPTCGLLSLAFAAVSFRMLQREIVVRRRAEETGDRRRREIEVLARISPYLQACSSAEEAHAYTAHVFGALFPGSSGAIAVAGAAPETLETVGSWGAPGSRRTFEPCDCWAMRRSAAHVWPENGTSPPCAHLTRPLAAAYMCLPLQVEGNAFGVLHLSVADPSGLDEARRAVAAGAVEQVSLALANLQLRDRLRRETLRDPLTGVHNRRFLDEALPRELALAQRRGRPLSVALIDADHFKSFNDRHGHDAGDQVLRALGDLLRERFRGTDLVCRYGGEEFVIVLPDAGLDDALERAEDVRRAACAMTVTAAGRELPPVTLSIGVATFPDHGATPARLLRAADTALYAAKSAGRDRVVVAETPTGSLA